MVMIIITMSQTNFVLLFIGGIAKGMERMGRISVWGSEIQDLKPEVPTNNIKITRDGFKFFQA